MACWSWMFRAGLLVAVLGSVGCAILPSHIHNPAEAEVAVKAQTEMAEYAKNAPGMYAAMLANVEKFKVEEDYLLSERAANVYTTVVTKLPTWTWGEFKAHVNSRKNKIGKFKQVIIARFQESKDIEQAIRDQITKAKETVQAFQKSVDREKENVKAWNVSVALFQENFSRLIEEASKQEKRREKLKKKHGIEQLKTFAKEMGEIKIKFRDAEGKIVEKTIKEILKEDIPDLLDKQDETGRNKLKEKLGDAPGIALVIMNLGLELAQIKKREAEFRLGQLRARKMLYEDALAAIWVAEKLLIEAEEDSDLFDDNKVIYVDLRDRWKSVKATRSHEKIRRKLNTITTALLVFRKAALAGNLLARSEAVFKLALVRLDHQHSIVESSINNEAWEAVIRSGLDGLVAYHQSGFKPEDAANIIRIAQSVALAFIAAEVD